jgi:hypothetical protein
MIGAFIIIFKAFKDIREEGEGQIKKFFNAPPVYFKRKKIIVLIAMKKEKTICSQV